MKQKYLNAKKIILKELNKLTSVKSKLRFLKGCLSYYKSLLVFQEKRGDATPLWDLTKFVEAEISKLSTNQNDLLIMAGRINYPSLYNNRSV